ncbi:hypothetical protein ON010_g4408 [Phytophthora cinnamomi]|nr:hypothetical protein ON010_g4408 [Phytophthora cinnamomi]
MNRSCCCLGAGLDAVAAVKPGGHHGHLGHRRAHDLGEGLAHEPQLLRWRAAASSGWFHRPLGGGGRRRRCRTCSVRNLPFLLSQDCLVALEAVEVRAVLALERAEQVHLAHRLKGLGLQLGHSVDRVDARAAAADSFLDATWGALSVPRKASCCRRLLNDEARSARPARKMAAGNAYLPVE